MVKELHVPMEFWSTHPGIVVVGSVVISVVVSVVVSLSVVVSVSVVVVVDVVVDGVMMYGNIASGNGISGGSKFGASRGFLLL